MADGTEIQHNHSKIGLTQSNPVQANDLSQTSQTANKEALRQEYGSQAAKTPAAYTAPLNNNRTIEIQTTPNSLPSTPMYSDAFLARFRNMQQNSFAASDLYQHMKGGITGLGTNERGIFDILRNRDLDEINAIKDTYSKKYGSDLINDLRAELKSDLRYSEHLEKLLQGDKLTSLISEFKLESSLPTKNFNHILSLLSEMDKATFNVVSERYLKETGNSLEIDLTTKLNDKEIAHLKAALSLDPVTIKNHQLGELIANSRIDPDTLIKFLRETSVNELNNLNTQLDKINDLYLKDAVKAFLEGNRPLAEAVLLQKELKDNSLNISRLASNLNGLSENQIASLQAEFKNRFSSNLIDQLEKIFPNGSLESAIAKEMLSNKNSPATQILTECISQRKDAALICQTIQSIAEQSSSVIQTVKQDILKISGQSLESHLLKALSNSQLLEASIALDFKVETLRDELNVLKSKYTFEKKQHDMLQKISPNLIKQEKHIERNLSELEESHTRLLDDGPDFNEAEEIGFYALLGLTAKDLKSYTVSKQKFYSILNDILGTLAGYISFRASIDLDFSYLEAAIAAITAFFAVRFFMQHRINKKKKLVARYVNKLKESKNQYTGIRSRASIRRSQKWQNVRF